MYNECIVERNCSFSCLYQLFYNHEYGLKYNPLYYLKRLAMQDGEREIDTLSVRRPQPHTTNR